ncbi:hypothetical protein AESSP_02193 [Aestuariimicrobium sp. T2.26MG-19.2B]|nr:hypothetical protein AESSP_02193 [Aestuariimicrobium sp. T2.26MG-19.2B]
MHWVIPQRARKAQRILQILALLLLLWVWGAPLNIWLNRFVGACYIAFAAGYFWRKFMDHAENQAPRAKN